LRPVPVDPPPVTIEVLVARARELLGFATRRAREVRLPQVAASLTFSSVLAIVPLLAVVLAIVTAFPIFSEMRSALEKDLPVGGILPDPYAKVIVRTLAEFAAKAAGVGALGLVILLASALSVILTIDRILNDIWQVHRRRPLLQRVLVYWAVLSVGPLLLGASLSLTSYLVGASAARVEALSGGMHHLLPIASPALAALAYSIVYVLVPHRPVRWRHAVAGGIVTAITGELMSRAFAAYIVHGGVYSIYGAFAAVPVFLMWIYLSWLTFLFGAALAATLPQLRATRFGDVHRPGERFVCAAAMLRILLQLRLSGAVGAARTTELAERVRVDHEEANAILGELQRLGYVRRLEGPVGAGEWILVCDPHTKGLAEAYHAFALDPGNSLLAVGDGGLARWLAPGLQGAWLQVGLGELEGAQQAVRPETPSPSPG
jgi:membrane protein